MNYAAEAWNATKDNTDAPYEQTEGEFRGKLDFAAERAIATGIANNPFEQKVLDLAKKADAEEQSHPLHVGVLNEDDKEKAKTAPKVREADKRSTATPVTPKPMPHMTGQDAELVAKEGIKPASKPEPAKASGKDVKAKSAKK